MKKALTASFAVATVFAASASGSGLHPASCFKAHHWKVRGTNAKGIAHPRPVTYYRYVHWNPLGLGGNAPRYFVLDSGLTRAQKHVARECLGRLG